jgi:Txe/YoeB family toxin of Txe-Axe toxin-antitoxin module
LISANEKPSRITWTLASWEDYNYLQAQDKKTLNQINALIQDTLSEPFKENL